MVYKQEKNQYKLLSNTIQILNLILKPRAILIYFILLIMLIAYQIIDGRYITYAKMYVEYRLERYFGENNIDYSNLSFYKKDKDINIYISDFRIYNGNNNMILIKEIHINLNKPNMFSIPKISSIYVDNVLISDDVINFVLSINNVPNNDDSPKKIKHNNTQITKGHIRKFFRFLDGIEYTFTVQNIQSSYINLEHIGIKSYIDKLNSNPNKQNTVLFNIIEKDEIKFFLMYFKNQHDAIYINMDATTSSKSPFWEYIFQSYIPEMEFVEHNLKFHMNGKLEFKNYNDISLSLDIKNLEGSFANKFCTLTNYNNTIKDIEKNHNIAVPINKPTKKLQSLPKYCSIKGGNLNLLVKRNGLYIRNLNILLDGLQLYANAEFSNIKKRINFQGNNFSEGNFLAIFNSDKNHIIGDTVYKFLQHNIYGFISKKFSGYYDVKTNEYFINADFDVKKLRSFMDFLPEFNDISGAINITNNSILLNLDIPEYPSISKFEINIKNDSNENYFLNINSFTNTQVSNIYQDYLKYYTNTINNKRDGGKFLNKINPYIKNMNNVLGKLEGNFSMLYNFQDESIEYKANFKSDELISQIPNNDQKIKIEKLIFDLKNTQNTLTGNTKFYINQQPSQAIITKDKDTGKLNMTFDSYISSDFIGMITANNDKIPCFNKIIKKQIKIQCSATSNSQNNIEFHGQSTGKINNLNLPFSNALHQNEDFILKFDGEYNSKNRRDFIINSLTMKSDDNISLEMRVESIGNDLTIDIDNLNVYDNALKMNFSRIKGSNNTKLSAKKLTYDEWLKFIKMITPSKKDKDENKKFFSFKNNKIDLQIKELELKNNIFVKNLVTNIDINKDIFKVNSYLKNGNYFSIDMIDKKEKNILISSNNLGDLIYGFTGQKYIVDGEAQITWNLTSGFKDYGNLVLKNFYLKTVPVIAKILSVASIDIKGIKNMVAGKGVSMYEANASFNYANGVLEVIDGSAYGAMLGFSFKGAYYIFQDEFIFYGSVIPVYNINKFMSSIPLIGDAFSDKDHQGIFTVDYNIRKENGEIKVKTNSLNAVTPGVFKKVFSR